MTKHDETLTRIAGVMLRGEPERRREPSTASHTHRWLPAGLVNAGTMVVQSCECGEVRKVRVPS